jgi:hypothetical protein
MNQMEALAAALAVEQQVIYGYGVAGAQPAGRDRALALAALSAHRVRRDRLAALLTAQGATPPAAAPAYALPFPVRTPAQARSLCALLEDGCAGAAWDLTAAAATRATRALGVSWLTEAATRAAAWRGPTAVPAALPGRPGTSG